MRFKPHYRLVAPLQENGSGEYDDYLFKLPKWTRFVAIDKDMTVTAFKDYPALDEEDHMWDCSPQSKYEVLMEHEGFFTDLDAWKEMVFQIDTPYVIVAFEKPKEEGTEPEHADETLS